MLIQHFDFSEIKVSDVLDLFVFNNQANATQFDGGPGLSFEYRISGGSFFALDAAAPQLFSSDIAIEKPDGVSRSGAVYDLIPHLLTNARFRFQGRGFAIEPALIFRALSGSRPLKSGVYDINLNAYFLKNNMLLVGGGVRSDKGGFHLQVGLSPLRNLQLSMSGEMHATLGATYEVGAAYRLPGKTPEGKPLVQTPVPGLTAVEKAYADLRVALITVDPEFSSIRNQQKDIQGVIETGMTQTDRKNKARETDNCVYRLAACGQDIERLRTQVQALDVQLKEAQVLARDVEVRGGVLSESVRNDIQTTGELYSRAQKQLDDLILAQNALSQQCASMRPEMTEAACIRDGDIACVEELFQQSLDAVPGRPENMFPLRVSLSGKTTVITYHFPDDAEEYLLSPVLRRLVGHLTEQISKTTGQGATLEQIIIETALQEDSSTLAYKPGLPYSGEFGNTLPAYTLIDNETNTITGKSHVLETGAEITLEDLAALKVAALRKNLADRGIPPGKMNLQVRYNRTENIYREETKIIIRMR